MNSVDTETLTPKCYFTEDVYMDGTFFVYPKNLEMTDNILDLLDRWYIDTVTTEGEVMNLNAESDDNKSDDKSDKPSNVISTDKPGEAASQTDPVFNDNEPIGDVYKRWSLTVVEFFKAVLVNQYIDKNAVVKLLDEIRYRVRVHRNDIM
ncbi:MAG: hypothetical protein J6Y01_07765, partial [Spirochaetales bacterium]|nr:hypothetical protein [Spirochaetales bacterium]